MSNKLDFETFKPKLHESYHKKMKDFFESKEAWDIYQYLKGRRPEKYTVLPRSDRTFAIFQEVPLENIKMIVGGQEPYSGYQGNKPQANGIALDCRNISPSIQPSLEYLYYCLQNNFPNMNIEQEGSLEKYTKQGVFLTNASLTVEKNAIATHIKLKKEEFPTKNLWGNFWKYVWEYVFNELPVRTPIILMGKAAQEMKTFIDPFRFVCLECAHSSFWARSFDKDATGDYVFLKANNVLEEIHGSGIVWGDSKDLTNDLPF